MTTQLVSWTKPYAGWAALGLLVAALFSSLLASNGAFPLILLFAAGALAAFRFWQELKSFDFWAFDEWLRMRHAAMGVPDWHSPHYAAELYCSQVVVRTRNEAAAEMNILMMEIIRGTGGNQVRAADPAVNFRLPAYNEQKPSDNDHADRNARYDAAQIRFNQCNAALSREMLTYLVRGDLLAKGLPAKDDVAQSERVVPTSRWRVMNLDIVKAQATGMGWHYAGLVVGVKPKPRKPNKPPGQPTKQMNPNGAPRARAPQAPRPDLPRPPRPSA